MEEKDLAHRFYEMFEKTTPVLEDVKKGFFTQNIITLKECETTFKDILKADIPFIEKMMGEKEKSEAEIKYLNLIPPIQLTASAMENLIEKMEITIELHILFSEKALNEIKELFTAMQAQLQDTKDYILTKNPNLKDSIKAGKEKLIRLANDYAIIHEQRLIAGVCMPKASYLYIDMTDSLKRIAWGLANFAGKV
jgi:Na+/phosphate symporter